MKIGIYAGTFDPIHNGHIEFATTAIAQACLDRIIVVAEKDPYRKEPHASWDHRQAMIERATQSIEHVDHDYRFANELAHQHNMQDMLANARKHYGEAEEIWFLVGSDVFEHMGEWENISKNFSYGGFVVAFKEDHTNEWLNEKLYQLRNKGINIHVEVVHHKKSMVNSSDIRNSVGSQRELKDIDKTVAAYIQKHQLYR